MYERDSSSIQSIFLVLGLLIGGIFAAYIVQSFPVHQALPPSSLLPPVPIKVSDANTLSILWVGDMVPTDNEFFNGNVFQNVAPLIKQADLSIGNVEGTFAQSDRLPKCFLVLSGCFAFRGSPGFALALRNAGFDFVSLVNNHALDFGKDGVSDSERTLASAGLTFISPFSPTKEIVVKNFQIGILGVSSGPPDALITKPAVVATMIANLKSHNDFVILIMHGGAEGADKTIVPGTEEYFQGEDRGNVELVAHTAINAGADLVLGSGPHVLRKIETYKDGVIAYSLGNFEGGNGKLLTKGILGTSGIFEATLSKTASPTYSFTSVSLSPNGIPSIDPTDAEKSLIESLSN